MLELTALAVLTTLREWGREPVVATRVIPADAAELHMLLSDPACQWRLVEGMSERLRPAARPAASCHPRFIHATVAFRGRDALWMTWILTPRRGTTEVDLAGQIETGSPVARLLWRLGGRRWLRRHLDATLATLAAVARHAAEHVDEVEGDAGVAMSHGAR